MAPHCKSQENSMQSFKLSDSDTFWLELRYKSKCHWTQQLKEDHIEWKKCLRAALNKEINRSDQQNADKIKLRMKWGLYKEKYTILSSVIQSKLTGLFRWQRKVDFYTIELCCGAFINVIMFHETFSLFFIYFNFFKLSTKKTQYSLHPVSCGAPPACFI